MGKAWRAAQCLPAMTCVCLGDQIRYNKMTEIGMIEMGWMSCGCRSIFFVGLALGGWGVLEDVGGVDVRVSQRGRICFYLWSAEAASRMGWKLLE